MADCEASSSTPNFQPGDLIWAKMKGFPPWPAKVLEQTEDTPARRIPVMFFGTLEKSFMKPTDLCDYLSNRTQHEISRKQKDFNKAVQEIREAAGVANEQDNVMFPVAAKSPPSSPKGSRSRQHSGRFLDVLLAGGADTSKRKRSNSNSTKSRSRASSNASTLRILREFGKRERKRLDSESSHGSKRKMISGVDNFEQYADSADFNALFNDALLGDLASLPDDNKSWKSKRSRASSKIFDEFIIGSSRTRNRSGSASGRRSRMISMSGFSGVSDMFDEIMNGSVEAHVEQLMITLNNMPSDGSIDRPLSPEQFNPQLPAPIDFCPNCGYECQLIDGEMKCNSIICKKMKESTESSALAVEGLLEEEMRNNKLNVPLSANVKTESISSGDKLNNLVGVPTSIDPPIKMENEPKCKVKIKIKKEDSDSSEADAKKDRKRKRVQLLSPNGGDGSNNSGSDINPQRDENVGIGRTLSPRNRARPKHYGYSKVEKTPPISSTGHRHCVFCNGQVRPQMCGGNRHRWRCVDKKCRKWYGWVRSHEEIPKNVNRKVTGMKPSPVAKTKIRKKEVPEQPESLQTLKKKVGRPSKNEIKIRLKLQKEQAKAAPSKQTEPMQSKTERRKYTKRKNKEGTKKRDTMQVEELKKRPISPLTDKELNYRPCAMEKRARWWTGEKRRMDVSPERELGTTAADTAAAFRMMAHAVRSAAVTRADEVGTVNGSLDLLMDTLIGSMGPLLSLMQKVPLFKTDSSLSGKFWESSAVHIPTFQ